MLARNGGVSLVVCHRCGVSVDSRVARYLFVLWGWRGRSSIRRPSSRRVYCGPCGDQLQAAFYEACLKVGPVSLTGLETERRAVMTGPPS